MNENNALSETLKKVSIHLAITLLKNPISRVNEELQKLKAASFDFITDNGSNSILLT